jgi:TonB family protein
MKLKYIVHGFFSLAAVSLRAQQPAQLFNDTTVLNWVEGMPSCPYNFSEYLGRNIHYPDSARTHDIEGRVVVKFIVHTDGSISDCVVMKGLGYGCDEEAKNAILKMPPWTPGTQSGQVRNVRMMLPITFKLEQSSPAPIDSSALSHRLNPEPAIWTYVDSMPTVDYDDVKYILQNIVVPKGYFSKKDKYSKTIRFVINEDGHISGCEIVNGEPDLLDAEVIRVVNSMKGWHPGKMHGKAVKVYMSFRLHFDLESVRYARYKTAFPND